MTPRDRILSVYRGATPDVVPYMLDLSHWYCYQFKEPWDLSRTYLKPQQAFIDYFRRHGIGFYLPNLASYFDVPYDGDVTASVKRHGDTITWKLATPIGAISRERTWEESSYSWGIATWAINNRHDLGVLAYALAQRRWTPAWDRYHSWVEAVGDQVPPNGCEHRFATMRDLVEKQGRY